MRKRLTYANVMATLAFFFALTGGALAGVKYLAATDPIASGSDLAGTYGAPFIADGKVTTSKLADGSVTSAKLDSLATAPNADRLNHHPSSDFPIVVGRGTIEFNNETFAAGGCEEVAVPPPAAINEATDHMIVQVPGGFASFMTAAALFDRAPGFDGPVPAVRVCSQSSFGPRSFSIPYIILR